MRAIDEKITFGLIVGSRNIFNAELATADRRKLLHKLEQLDFDYVIPDEKATTDAFDTVNNIIELLKEFNVT